MSKILKVTYGDNVIIDNIDSDKLYSKTLPTLNKLMNGNLKIELIHLIPSEYKEVEYIQTTSTGPFILTDILFTSSSTPLEASWSCVAENSSGINYCLAGCGDGQWKGPIMLNYCGNRMEFGTNGYQAAGNYTPGTKYSYTAYINNSEQEYAQDGTVFLTKTNTYVSSSYPLALFAFNYYGTTTGTYFLGKLYNFTIKCAGSTVGDFIPVKRVSDSVVGLYDLIRRKFYTNSGSGSFVAGPEV